MKTNNSVLFGLIASASTAVAQIVNCDGNQSPDWDDCTQPTATIQCHGDEAAN